MKKAVGKEWHVMRGRDCVTPSFCRKGQWIHTCVWHLGFLNDSSASLIFFYFIFCKYVVSGCKGKNTWSQQQETFQPVCGTTDGIAVESFLSSEEKKLLVKKVKVTLWIRPTFFKS